MMTNWNSFEIFAHWRALVHAFLISRHRQWLRSSLSESCSFWILCTWNKQNVCMLSHHLYLNRAVVFIESANTEFALCHFSVYVEWITPWPYNPQAAFDFVQMASSHLCTYFHSLTLTLSIPCFNFLPDRILKNTQTYHLNTQNLFYSKVFIITILLFTVCRRTTTVYFFWFREITLTAWQWYKEPKSLTKLIKSTNKSL